jgi:hypothetical protein
MCRRHYGIELTKSQSERHFDKVVWKTSKTRVHVLWSGPFHVCANRRSIQDAYTIRY